MVVDQLLFRLSISLSILEIFAIEVWSCPKSQQFLEDFCQPIFQGGQSPQKLYPLDHACLAARHPEKFGEVAPLHPKVIGAHTPNFKPIFECPLLKIVGGTPIPSGVCARKPWSFSSVCKNLSRQRPLGAEIWSSEKVDFGGSKCTSKSLELVDQSSPDFFRLTREELLWIH